MHDVVERYVAALAELDEHVGAIGPQQWHEPTPCTEWDVRALVDHLVYETLWVPDLIAGKTLAEVGDHYDGDRLGDDPVAAWKRASAAAVAGVRSSTPGVRVHTSGGEVTADAYLTEMLFDAVIHGWDLARGIGVAHVIPDDVARDLEAWVTPLVDVMVTGGSTSRPVETGAEEDPATRLIALSGRTP
ncbi:MAG: TIGR03086 family metal-binding protein [Actinomycetota bacterium]